MERRKYEIRAVFFSGNRYRSGGRHVCAVDAPVMAGCICAFSGICPFRTVLPILLTGGIHMDGFMDTMDALHSYQDRERKLEILKDSHVGAFACLSLICEMFLYAAALFFLLEERQMLFLGIGFFCPEH